MRGPATTLTYCSLQRISTIVALAALLPNNAWPVRQIQADRLAAAHAGDFPRAGADGRRYGEASPVKFWVCSGSMVVDRETALVPLVAGSGADNGYPTLAIVREPTLVSWFVANFEALWSDAVPLSELLGRDQVLADGAPDARVADPLGDLGLDGERERLHLALQRGEGRLKNGPFR